MGGSGRRRAGGELNSMMATSMLRAALTGCLLFPPLAFALNPPHPPCRVQASEFEGWPAEQVSNGWVQLTIVPKLGGRLMQVRFADHDYLFVNPVYKGKYLPPEEGAAKGKWFNYGGDKIWPMPEGTGDDHHWAGPLSDPLDDGIYRLTVLSQDPSCRIRLEGPPDTKTGLQYTREIALARDSPEISFQASMRNISGHPIEWSMQSVTQYDTSDRGNTDAFNRDFWAFTPVNPQSAYFNAYQVRDGLADDPSFAVEQEIFKLHWLYLENEVWLDSPAGWLAVVDGASQYAMVERFPYEKGANYPGKATVIFYKNGAALELDEKGMPHLRTVAPRERPYYMEAEVNSPVVRLEPGASYTFDTRWFPTRAGHELGTVTDGAIVNKPLAAEASGGGVLLSASLGVFFPGELVVQGFDARGIATGTVPLLSTDPATTVELHQQVRLSPQTVRVEVHLLGDDGVDRGTVGAAFIRTAERGL
jgi:hypothetical protein